LLWPLPTLNLQAVQSASPNFIQSEVEEGDIFWRR